MKTMGMVGIIISFVSFLWVLGSVGACECENIDIVQCIVQSIIGLVGLYFGIGLVRYAEGE